MSNPNECTDRDDFDIRHLLQKWVAPHLPNQAAREEAAEAIGVTLSSINSMYYHAQGSILAWQRLMMYCFEIEPKNVEGHMHALSEVLANRTQRTPGQEAWAKAGAVLTDQERIFYSEVALAIKAVKAEHSS